MGRYSSTPLEASTREISVVESLTISRLCSLRPTVPLGPSLVRGTTRTCGQPQTIADTDRAAHGLFCQFA
jgi:hypothetical protein